MFIHTIPVGVFQCNCTILACDRTKTAIVIDPGDEPERIIQIIRENELKVISVIHTHAHIDHIMGTFAVVEKTGAVPRLHADELRVWNRVEAVAKSHCIPAPKLPVLGDMIIDGEIVYFGRDCLRVIHTPGHTPGSCCFALECDNGRKLLLSGDTLFRGKVGFAFPYPDTSTNFKTIITSIRDRILTLEDDTLVIPGHGVTTTIGIERRTNPFLS